LRQKGGVKDLTADNFKFPRPASDVAGAAAYIEKYILTRRTLN